MLHLSHQVWLALLWVTTAGSLAAGAELAQLPLAVRDTNVLSSSASVTNSAFKRISEHGYSLGLVSLNRKERTITFPGLVNMSDGLVEYALVHAKGKVHESVFKTDADPLHIHLAKLLLSPAEEDKPAADPRMPRELLGAKISVWVSWTQEGATKRVRLDELILNTLTKSIMTRGDWIYGGSRVVDGTYLAQRDGSIIAIIADPDAMVNNPRPGRNDDEIWKANNAVVPPVGTPVQVTFELEETSENPE